MLIRESTDKVLTSLPAKSSERKHEIRCMRSDDRISFSQLKNDHFLRVPDTGAPGYIARVKIARKQSRDSLRDFSARHEPTVGHRTRCRCCLTSTFGATLPLVTRMFLLGQLLAPTTQILKEIRWQVRFKADTST
jgi:hypothetical protein